MLWVIHAYVLEPYMHTWNSPVDTYHARVEVPH